MGKQTTISIAKDFSRFPAGRKISDGPYSGEAFRERRLIPALEKFDHIVVNLDGTRGYGSSFLEEVFGGLVRAGIPKDKSLAALEIISEDDPALPNVIVEYIMNGDVSEQ